MKLLTKLMKLLAILDGGYYIAPDDGPVYPSYGSIAKKLTRVGIPTTNARLIVDVNNYLKEE